MQIPNHTQIPNDVLDNMGHFEGAELKIFLAICRKTIGWHKLTDRISYSQIKKMTGLSINGIRKAMDKLINKKFINQVQINNGFVYEINFGTPDSTMQLSDIAQNDIALSDKTMQLSDTKKRKTVPLSNTTKDNIKETIQNKIKKSKFQEYVLLSKNQYDKLVEDYGSGLTNEFISKLNDYIGSKGKKYRSHYHTIKVWMRQEGIKPKLKKAEIKNKLKYTNLKPRTETEIKNMKNAIKNSAIGDRLK